MPTISLRLTDEEHAALKEWAHGSHRSMQREAVYRIFADKVAPEFVPIAVEVSEQFLDEIKSVPVERDPHFKPDFK